MLYVLLERLIVRSKVKRNENLSLEVDKAQKDS